MARYLISKSHLEALAASIVMQLQGAGKMFTLFLGLGTLVVSQALADDAVDPRGPINYPGISVTVDPSGVQASGYAFKNDCQKPGPWLARWIWLDIQAPSVAGMFRNEIKLDDSPRAVKVWLTADAQYRLYVNGHLASRGPVDIGRDYAGGSTHKWFYDFRDLTPYFAKGNNVIAVEVFSRWPAWAVVSRGHPGLLFEAHVTRGDGSETVVKSDGSWRATPAAQYPDTCIYDIAKEPVGWRVAGFDDSTWAKTREVEDVWGTRVPAEIPPRMEARYPVWRIEGLPTKTVNKDTQFSVVFDRVLSGYPTLMVHGGKGAELKIHANHEFKAILSGGRQLIEFPLMDEIAPSFSVTLSHVSEPVEILDAGADFTSQPVEYKGSFECSDDRLNQIWKTSRWAVQICLQTHHLDSPHNLEPISDPGDYLIESMVNDYAFAQPWLARQDIRKFAWLLKDEHYHNFHTSYSIAWLQMLMDYYDYTGDRSLLEEMSPYVFELLDTYTSWLGKNGIISEAPNYMFMDWVQIGGFPCHHPPAVIGQGYLTAFYCHGLEMACRTATLVGDPVRAQKYADLRTKVTAAFNRELWVGEKGLYRDGKPFETSVPAGRWLPADRPIETFSAHVNLLAVLYDLAPKELQQSVVRKVLAEQPLNTQPWFMHFGFAAIDHAGLLDTYGTEQMRRWQIVPETKSFHEMWNSGDLSHGWCSTPLVQMSARILGVTPSSPGFGTISIRPELCDLSWAKGKVPTPLGSVGVSWRLGNDQLSLDVTLPLGTSADVLLPVDRFDKPACAMDQKPCQAVVHLLSGEHHFTVTGKTKGGTGKSFAFFRRAMLTSTASSGRAQRRSEKGCPSENLRRLSENGRACTRRRGILSRVRPKGPMHGGELCGLQF
jgi:hypothetical protein